MKAFHIAQWDTLYETSASRKVTTLSYYSKPNKLVGEGIGITLQDPHNVALLGTWALIEALASTAPRHQRGWLVRGGTALTPARMAALTRVDEEHFDRALKHFCRPEIGWLELGELPGDSPTNPPTPGELPGDSPDTLPLKSEGEKLPGRFRQERKTEEGRRKGEGSEEEAHTGATRIPSISEVREWARTCAAGVDPEFACLKFEQANDRGDFAKPAWLKDWRSKLERFWREDGPDWVAKNKKNARRPGERPDGWKAGDQDFWWSDSVADLRGALRGAVQGEDKKTANRLREIIALREGTQ